MFFFIREVEHSENRNKITSYNEKNITVNVDQDPINQQLVFDVQTSYNQQARWVSTTSNFSYQLMYLQVAHRASVASENYYMQSDVQRQTFAHLLQKYL